MKSKNDLEVLVKVKYEINIDVPKIKKNIIEESNTIEKQGNKDIIEERGSTEAFTENIKSQMRQIQKKITKIWTYVQIRCTLPTL